MPHFQSFFTPFLHNKVFHNLPDCQGAAVAFSFFLPPPASLSSSPSTLLHILPSLFLPILISVCLRNRRQPPREGSHIAGMRKMFQVVFCLHRPQGILLPQISLASVVQKGRYGPGLPLSPSVLILLLSSTFFIPPPPSRCVSSANFSLQADQLATAAEITWVGPHCSWALQPDLIV